MYKRKNTAVLVATTVRVADNNSIKESVNEKPRCREMKEMNAPVSNLGRQYKSAQFLEPNLNGPRIQCHFDETLDTITARAMSSPHLHFSQTTWNTAAAQPVGFSSALPMGTSEALFDGVSVGAGVGVVTVLV